MRVVLLLYRRRYFSGAVATLVKYFVSLTVLLRLAPFTWTILASHANSAYCDISGSELIMWAAMVSSTSVVLYRIFVRGCTSRQHLELSSFKYESPALT